MGTLLPNQALSQYTSWRIGGPADYVYLPQNLADLTDFIKQLSADSPLTWLGLGSNTLVRDAGLDGVAIVTQGALNGLSQLENGLVRAEAGVSCAQLARFSARLSGAGLEFLAGIPGTVGGALAMNAGCFGGETWQRVQAVETINRQGEINLRPAAAFSIGYRQVKRPENEWFVAGHFLPEKGDKTVSLAKIHDFLERRNTTQPTGTANCGSVFRNPKGDFAGRLIESCGLKGKRFGGAQVSEKHANFILNTGTATAADVEGLIAEIKTIVEAQTGVALLPEVCIIGRM